MEKIYPLQMKLNIFQSCQLRLTPEQIDRFLKFRSLVFHLLTFLWHMLLNYQTIAGAFYILFNRKDLVNKTCGFGIQYVTIWNQVIEQTYFNASLLLDILELNPNPKYAKIRAYLKAILPYTLSSIVFPMSILVTLNFWGIYSYYPRVIDEDNVTESFFPNWVNHGLHTTILLLACIEKFIAHRSYSIRFWSFVGLFIVLMSYSATFGYYAASKFWLQKRNYVFPYPIPDVHGWKSERNTSGMGCTLLYFIGGVWPYPLFEMMSIWQRIIFVICNCTLGFIILRIERVLDAKLWGEYEKKTS